MVALLCRDKHRKVKEQALALRHVAFSVSYGTYSAIMFALFMSIVWCAVTTWWIVRKKSIECCEYSLVHKYLFKDIVGVGSICRATMA